MYSYYIQCVTTVSLALLACCFYPDNAFAQPSASATTLTLQQGLNGYDGCSDRELRDPSRNFGRGPHNDFLVVSEYCPGCPYARAALRFDLSSLPADAQIASATVELFAAGYDGGSQTGDYSLFRLSRRWSDTEANWNDALSGEQWARPGGDYGARVVATTTCPRAAGATWVAFNVLAAVREMAGNQQQNFGFIIVNTRMAQSVEFVSSDNSTVARRPKLTITYSDVANIVREMPRTHRYEGGYRTENRMPGDNALLLLRPDGKRVLAAADQRGGPETPFLRSAGIYIVTGMQSGGGAGKRVAIFP
jgi:hypothetical protein